MNKVPENWMPDVGSSRALLKSTQKLGFHVWQSDSFCHYTDLCGLMGIVENNEIWLSDHRFLNDVSEHSYGQQLAIDVIKTSISTEQDTIFNQILNSVLKSVTDHSPVFYIAAMSLAKDRLDQWKGYGRNNDSVCLVFENDSSLGREGVLTRLPSIEPLQVIYEPRVQKERITTVISTFRDEILSGPCKVSDTFSLWEKDLAYLVTHQFIRFKHPEYSSEQEIRLVVGAGSPALTAPPKHRVTNGRIIPYMTTKNPSSPLNAKLPLKEVIVGPTSTLDAIIRSIEVFLANMGYTDTLVSPSSVPFRG